MAIIDRPTDYFRTKLYTGNGSDGQVITYDESENMTPNFVWIKERNATSQNKLIDSVRGADKAMSSSNITADDTFQYFADFDDANGFTIGSTNGATNQNNNTFASWNWKELAGVFDIVSFTGNGTARTIAHNLGVVPTMYIVKNRDTVDLQWRVYHKSFGATKHFALDNIQVVGDAASVFNDTEPTSSVFSVGTDDAANKNTDNLICYLFADSSMSKMGSYSGSGNADGPFIHTKFKPAFIMIKRTDAENDWLIQDSKRYPSNQSVAKVLKANSAVVEGDTANLDILSNGFKLRNTTTNINVSGSTYIYMCFAEQPFVTSTGVPATAR